MGRKGTQMFRSFLRGMEAVSKCQAMNRRVGTDPKTMLGRPYLFDYVSTDNCISRTMTRRGINNMPKCFSILKNGLKRLGEAHTTRTKLAMADPRPTADLRQLADHEAANETPKCFSNLGDCSGLSKEARR